MLSRLPTRLGPRSKPAVRNLLREGRGLSIASNPPRSASFTSALKDRRCFFTAALSLAATSSSSVSVVLTNVDATVMRS